MPKEYSTKQDPTQSASNDEAVKTIEPQGVGSQRDLPIQEQKEQSPKSPENVEKQNVTNARRKSGHAVQDPGTIGQGRKNEETKPIGRNPWGWQSQSSVDSWGHHSNENSDLNSEEEPRYNYFGNYRSLFKGEKPLNQSSQKRSDPFGMEDSKTSDDQSFTTPQQSGNIAARNEAKNVEEPKRFSFSFQNPESHSQAILSKTPGIGLFSTNREKKASNYQSFFSFGSPKQEPRYAPQRAREGYDQFITGSEDDSGFFSETSLPSNNFSRPYFSLNNEYYPDADRSDKNYPFPTLPNENVNLTKLFFPHLDMIVKKDQKQGAGMFEFENSDDFEEDTRKLKQPFFDDSAEFTRKDDSQLGNFGFHRDEVRQRKPGDYDADEQILNLPPGLYDLKKDK